MKILLWHFIIVNEIFQAKSFCNKFLAAQSGALSTNLSSETKAVPSYLSFKRSKEK